MKLNENKSSLDPSRLFLHQTLLVRLHEDIVFTDETMLWEGCVETDQNESTPDFNEYRNSMILEMCGPHATCRSSAPSRRGINRLNAVLRYKTVPM